MIEKGRESLDEAGAYKALLTDLSKSFDCLPYELIIAKLYAYGSDMPPLKLINSHLSKRRRRIKINDVHSSWSEAHFEIPQGSVLGPFLFNLFICDLFMFVPKNGIANYANDNTSHSAGTGSHNIVSNLQQASGILSNWFQDNYLKANPDKYHVLLSETQLIIKNISIASSCCKELLGIKEDHKLSFEKSQCTGMDDFIYKIQTKKILLKAFVTARLSYALEVWMFHSKS